MGLLAGAPSQRALGAWIWHSQRGMERSCVTAGCMIVLFPDTVQTTHSDEAESYLLCINTVYLLFWPEAQWKTVQVASHRWISTLEAH